MKLVEAYRYSNYITHLMDNVRLLLMKPEFMNNVTLTKHMSGSVPNGEDATELQARDEDFDPDLTMNFLLALFEEKKNLLYAIEHAKPQDTDAEIALNKDRRTLGVLFSNLGNAKEKTVIDTRDSTYGVGADGVQNVYQFKVDKTLTVRYNRVMARAIGKEMMRQAEEVSMRLDAEKLTCEVNFHPLFDITDTLEEAFGKYTASQTD